MAKHRLVNKGLTGCGINTAAAVGTVFNVTYWVFDGGQPTANATVTRSVVISQRCKDDENFCADFSGGLFLLAHVVPPGTGAARSARPAL